MLMSDHQHSSILIKASHPCSKRTSPLCASGTMVMTRVKMCLCEWIQTHVYVCSQKGSWTSLSCPWECENKNINCRMVLFLVALWVSPLQPRSIDLVSVFMFFQKVIQQVEKRTHIRRFRKNRKQQLLLFLGWFLKLAQSSFTPLSARNKDRCPNMVSWTHLGSSSRKLVFSWFPSTPAWSSWFFTLSEHSTPSRYGRRQEVVTWLYHHLWQNWCLW